MTNNSDSGARPKNDGLKPKSYTEANIARLPKSEVEITGSIPSSHWESYRKEAVKNLNESINLPGFRKGAVPENILISKVGEMAILEEMAELALPKSYLDLLLDNKIDAIGRPRIQITKLARGNPLEFKATTAVVPELKLPDYKKIAALEVKRSVKEKIEVSEKDIDEAVLRVRKMHASHEGHDHDKMTPDEHEKAIMESLPELTDDFVRKIGDFKDAPDFKKKLSAMLHEDKKDAHREKVRIAIADKIAAETKVEIPDLMIETELNRTEAQFKADIEKMGVKMEDYLKHAKKTAEEIRKEWIPSAEKKSKLQLLLNEIAKTENIHPTAAEIESEVRHILDHYKDADRERAETYAETVLTNDKVFEFLESQSIEK